MPHEVLGTAQTVKKVNVQNKTCTYIDLLGKLNMCTIYVV